MYSFFMWAQGYMCCLLFAWSCDVMLKRFLAEASVRWFVLHAICNMTIAALAAGDVVDCIADHSYSRLPASSGYPLRMATAVHVYHVAAFPMRPEDWFHHVGFVFPSALACYHHETKGFALCAFFICGAPGAIDYLVLAGSKLGYVTTDLRRRLYGLTSLCIRMPGAVLGSSLLIQDGLKYRGAGCVATGMLALMNGVYYGHQAAWSAGYHASQANVVKENACGQPTKHEPRADAGRTAKMRGHL